MKCIMEHNQLIYLGSPDSFLINLYYLAILNALIDMIILFKHFELVI
jgi:hypothetical protein